MAADFNLPAGLTWSASDHLACEPQRRHTNRMRDSSSDKAVKAAKGSDQRVVDRTSESARMTDMLKAANQSKSWPGSIRTDDGWRAPLESGEGFRHEFDDDVADGAWEFHILKPGLSLAIVDYTVVRPTPRLHAPGDNLVLSAVLSGETHMQNRHGFEGDLVHGYCTVYGLNEKEEFRTFYAPGLPLKWVSVFITRDVFFTATGLGKEGLPDDLIRFVDGDAETLPPQNVPLSNAALAATADIFDKVLPGAFTRAFLTAKALELACQILFFYSRSIDEGLSGLRFSQSDFDCLHEAKALLEKKLDSPVNIQDLSTATGLTRQKLQLGFRLLFGDTVARVRDKIRMEHALDLVRTSELSLIQVALETGYEHHASFTRAFKAAYGLSPSNMRQIAQEANALAEKSKVTTD